MSYSILIIDDEVRFRKEFIECFEEYSFVEARSGEEALKVLRKPNQVDLIILDVMMPGEKGTQTLKQIKNKFPNIPVIILTGFSSKDIAVEALKGKADYYLEKPFNIKKTRELLKRFLLDKKGNFNVDATNIKGKIEKIKEYLLKNADKKVVLEDAAKLVFFSPKYLSRMFGEVSGKGFNDFKLEAKMKKAKELLVATGYSVEQIADKLGYLNSESLIRIFKKRFKLTPAAFRKKRRK